MGYSASDYITLKGKNRFYFVCNRDFLEDVDLPVLYESPIINICNDPRNFEGMFSDAGQYLIVATLPPHAHVTITHGYHHTNLVIIEKIINSNEDLEIEFD